MRLFCRFFFAVSAGDLLDSVIDLGYKVGVRNDWVATQEVAMWETEDEKGEHDALLEEWGDRDAEEPRLLLESDIAYASDVEQDLVIEIPLANGNVARATLSPEMAFRLLEQIKQIVGVA